uniref:Pentatricopeptide repeat-containing protein n=1 Tax=Ananas comosus var. bracteatus TaxID=296719 RepID=A0A6V7QRH2_ANACO
MGQNWRQFLLIADAHLNDRRRGPSPPPPLHGRCRARLGALRLRAAAAAREAGAVHALLVTSGALRSSPSALTALISAYSALSLPALALRALVASPHPPTSALVRSYLRLRLPDDAAHLFDELPRRDVVLWNALLNGLAQLGRFGPALECFRRMLGAGVAPSKFTVTGILSVFTATADLGSGRKVHAFAVKAAHDREASVANALVDLYGKCHELGDAAEVFASIADDDKDLFSWNSMLCALHYSADNVGVLRLLAHMRRAAVWPDAVTMAAVLPACAHMAALRLGREIHGFLVTSGMFGNDGGGSLDVFAANALEDMYAKSGALEDARCVFDRMPERDAASWNIMIDGDGGGGARIAAADEGGVSVEPEAEHYACAADMLGRAGRLEEAKQVAEKAGEAGAWRAYLAACRMHGEAGMAEEAARRMLEFEGGERGWVLLASAYGLAGASRGWRRWGPSASASTSTAAGEGRTVHVFVSGDREHPEMERIHQMLHGLVGRMRECGYVPDLNI